jgi:hypothetical protein
MRSRYTTRFGVASILTILALGLACGLTACDTNTTVTVAATTPPSPTVTVAPAPTLTPTSTSSGNGNPGPCQTSQLTLALVSSDGAAGHIRYLYTFTNASTDACTFNGYPVVSGFPSSVQINDVTQAYTWPTVQIVPITLAPNSVAYFALQADTATSNGNTCQSATPSIAPPQNSGGFTAPNSITTCDGHLYVSPLVPNETDL